MWIEIATYSNDKYYIDKYSSVPNCRGGHFAIFENFQPQNHLIMTPPFYDLIAKKGKNLHFPRGFC